MFLYFNELFILKILNLIIFFFFLELSIIKQKSIKLDLELEKAEDNARDINREIRNQQKILEQMDLKIYKNHEQQETEKKHLELEQGDLIEKFKVSKTKEISFKLI